MRWDGNCEGGACQVHCTVNGDQTDSFTVLGSSPDSYSCDDPFVLAELAARCRPRPTAAGIPPRKWTVDEMVADPDGWHRSTLDEVRRENPQMTDEQLENDWQYVKQLFGL